MAESKMETTITAVPLVITKSWVIRLKNNTGSGTVAQTMFETIRKNFQKLDDDAKIGIVRGLIRLGFKTKLSPDQMVTFTSQRTLNMQGSGARSRQIKLAEAFAKDVKKLFEGVDGNFYGSSTVARSLAPELTEVKDLYLAYFALGPNADAKYSKFLMRLFTNDEVTKVMTAHVALAISLGNTIKEMMTQINPKFSEGHFIGTDSYYKVPCSDTMVKIEGMDDASIEPVIEALHRSNGTLDGMVKELVKVEVKHRVKAAGFATPSNYLMSWENAKNGLSSDNFRKVLNLMIQFGTFMSESVKGLMFFSEFKTKPDFNASFAMCVNFYDWLFSQCRLYSSGVQRVAGPVVRGALPEIGVSGGATFSEAQKTLLLKRKTAFESGTETPSLKVTTVAVKPIVPGASSSEIFKKAQAASGLASAVISS